MDIVERARQRLGEIEEAVKKLAQEETQLKDFLASAGAMELLLGTTVSFPAEREPQTKNQPTGKQRYSYEGRSTPQEEIWAKVEGILRAHGRPMSAAELWAGAKQMGVKINARNGRGVQDQFSARLSACPAISARRTPEGWLWWFKGESFKLAGPAARPQE